MKSTSLLLCISFLLTGCFNSVITQVIYNFAPINSKSMLLVFCAYVGYALRYFIRDGSQVQVAKKIDEEKGDKPNRKRDKPKEKAPGIPPNVIYLYMFGLVVVEVFAAQLAMISFGLIGSGLYQVLYSSIIIFTALVSVFLLHKKINKIQWLALLLLTAGLMLSAGRVSATDVPIEGIIYLFISTFIYAVTSSLSEIILNKFNFPSSKYSMYYGFYGTVIVGLYIMIVTTSNWEEWVMEPIKARGGESGVMIVLGLMLILVSGQLIRGIVYYKCIAELGSVSTGVLYALQAICMFSLSATLFCDKLHPNQCFTMSKGIGSLVVAGGVALYSIGKQEQEKEKR